MTERERLTVVNETTWACAALICMGDFRVHPKSGPPLRKEKKMAHVLAYLPKVENWKNWKNEKRLPYQGVVKHDWVPTGRIDLETRLNGSAEDAEQPSEFKLLVEERRIVESIAGNENLEIQWRLATLKEAKAVVTQYHKYLSENALIKSIVDDTIALPPPNKKSANSSA